MPPEKICRRHYFLGTVKKNSLNNLIQPTRYQLINYCIAFNLTGYERVIHIFKKQYGTVLEKK